MTEAEWLAASDPMPILDFLRGKVSDRKLRLFAVACCRRVWNLLSNKFSRQTLKITERFADGEVSQEKLGFAWGDARRSARVTHNQEGETAYWESMRAVTAACALEIVTVLGSVRMAARSEAYPNDPVRLAFVHKEQVTLLRDIFGNPFRPTTLNPSWLTSTVLALANAIYHEKAFYRMPILADALQDAACDNEHLLKHCDNRASM